jgi:NAD-dependent dihydropyrimidine dehydrogenase PreA subunit
MIYYFTGTGNSLWTAKTLQKELNEPIANLADAQETPLNCADKLIGFVFPTYMGDLPWLCKKILLSAKLNADSDLFLVMTSSGGTSGRAFSSMDQALCSIGCHLGAAFDLQMPGNCIVSSAAENAARLAAAPEKVRSIAESVKARECGWISSGKRAGKGFVEHSFFYGTHSLARLTIMKHFRVTNACTGCGVCASVCPTQNIEIKNGRAVHGDNCAACYACMHWCPVYATHLMVPGLSNRPQYHHPEITLSEVQRKGE